MALISFFALLILSVYFLYGLYGIIQEEISTKTFDSDTGPARWVYTLTLLLCQTTTQTLAAALYLNYDSTSVQGRGTSNAAGKAAATARERHSDGNSGYLQRALVALLRPPPRRLVTPLLVMSALYLGAMCLSNSALYFIDYPTQSLMKGAKVTVIAACSCCCSSSGRPVGRRRTAAVLLVTLGMVLFTLGRPDLSSPPNGLVSDGSVGGDAAPGSFLLDSLSLNPRTVGFLLVCLSLACDGAMATVQDSVVYGQPAVPGDKGAPAHPPIHPAELMYYINGLAAVYVFFAVLIVGEAGPAIAFVLQHPQVLWLIFLFCATSTLGQAAIFTLIRHHGALTCAIVTTTRKFLTVLLSVALYSHTLSVAQWAGVTAVFAGLAADIYVSSARHPPTLPR